jgi:hypothetical protein
MCVDTVPTGRAQPLQALHLLKGHLLSSPIPFVDQVPFGNGELTASPVPLPSGHCRWLSLPAPFPCEQVQEEAHVEV